MVFKIRVKNNFWCLLFLTLCISKVCQGQLMCYVCDNCAQVTTETLQVECNDDFFNTGKPTDSSIKTTTEQATTTIDETTLTPSTNDAEETTVTESKSTESTTAKVTTENTTVISTETTPETIIVTITETTQKTTTTTTEDRPPSPPTVGPITAVPTPPNPGTVRPLDDIDTLNNQSVANREHANKDEIEIVDIEQGTTKTYKPSAEFRVRQLRSVSDVTFHCFKVEATVNGTMLVNRGCSRVQTEESVCGQWESQHPDEKMNKCYPCSTTKCNGTSALSVSITALFLAIVAVFMQRK